MKCAPGKVSTSSQDNVNTVYQLNLVKVANRTRSPNLNFTNLFVHNQHADAPIQIMSKEKYKSRYNQVLLVLSQIIIKLLKNS